MAKTAVHPEFLGEAALDRRIHGLTLPGMGAARIGPKKRPQAFRCTALLKQQFARPVEDEQRKGSVENAVAVVTGALVEVADLAVGLIHENEGLPFVGDDRAAEPGRVNHG